MKKAILIFILFVSALQNCTRIEVEGTPFGIWADGSSTIFPDMNGKGFYLIDNRKMFKYMMYHFSIDSSKWTPVSDGNGLLIESKAGPAIFKVAFVEKTDKIFAAILTNPFQNEKTIYYEYSKADNIWNKVKIQDGDIFNNPGEFCYNLFTNEIFQVKDQELYSLNENYEWAHKADFTQPVTNNFHFVFTGPDTLVYFNKSGFYQLNISQNNSLFLNSFTGDTMKIGAKSICLLNNNICYTNYSNYGFIEGSESDSSARINKLTFYPFAFNEISSFHIGSAYFVNPLDKILWGDRVFLSEPILFSGMINHQYYIFRNDVGYVYSETDKAWNQLPYLDYIELNKK